MPKLQLSARKKRRQSPRFCVSVPHFPEYFPGGAEIQSYFVARHMVERGWSVHFVTEDRGRRPAAVESLDGICIHNLKGVRFFNPIRCWRFYRELLRINADVYYQRGGTEYTFATYLAAKTLGKKFVWATAVLPDCEGNKFRRSLREEGAKGIKRLLLMPDAWIRDALVSLGRRGAHTIVVQDQSQYQGMKETFGVGAIIIRSGHPIPAAPGRKERPPVVVWIANVKKRKRPSLFVRLAQECADLDAKFVLVGGKTEPRYRYELMKESAGVANLDVRWALTFGETNELLARASLLANTSTFEGYPNTFVQAWLRETPVVTLGVDPDGVLAREGIGVRSGRLSKMVEDVRRLVRDEQLRNEMGKRARAYAVREHNLVEKLEAYDRLFESLFHECSVVQPA